ncbi:DUF2382 domain-containing protein [Kribbella pittospori]|uniref:DUF2382 domain-containing protein n=1 Tax=Kribbella pittospori TaxID=722689 RepID=A0A4R0KBF9_9ACTN|nr:PRC and DUF2382 domain-containing protein [Kribbella pittospori]TCC55298.1 DUF2382 domain-containing protein [Kribbella pittospori]
MIDQDQVQRLIGRDAYGSDGDKIGRVGQVFLDDQTGRPDFATVNTGLFGMSESFVPLVEAMLTDAGLSVPFTKERVKDAPNVSPDDGHLSEEDEQLLFEYYGLGYAARAERHRDDSGNAGDDVVGRDTSGPTTDQAMTRSEERLDVGTQRQEAGRVRLRKYVETEQVQTTVPVQRERAVVEREPITDANIDAATSGPEISEEEHEVVLHEEKPVVGTHTEPVERVRLGKEQRTDEETVSGEVRKERIETDGDIDSK